MTPKPLCRLDALAPDSAKLIEIDGLKLSVVRIEDEIFVIADTCSHANFSLSEGDIDPFEKTIECWKHGAEFSLETGEPQCLPATKPVPVYDTKVIDGTIYLTMSDVSDPDEFLPRGSLPVDQAPEEGSS